MAGKTVSVLSPAKINWTLRVITRRADGYHEIESLVSPITLYDELTLTGRAGSELELSCEHPAVPRDESNLIKRAARKLSELSGCTLGATCRLVKRIPPGGGLGGGSSNAAATLVGLNRLWSLNWPVERLHPIAAEIGSDVPLFLAPGSAIIRGRGERLQQTAVAWRGWLVLLLPPFAISTAAVYKAWGSIQAAPNLEELQPVSDLDAVVLMRRTFNMLEAPAISIEPRIGALLRSAEALAGRPVRMSGSGSTVFTAFNRRSEAAEFAGRVQERLAGIQTRLVQLTDGA